MDDTGKKVAEEFVSLWQEQMKHIMSDPALASSWWTSMQSMMPSGAAPFAHPAMWGQNGHDKTAPFGFPIMGGAAPSAHSPHDSTDANVADGRAMVELYARLAGCEARIAALESQLAATRGKS